LGGQSPFRGLDAPLALLFSYHTGDRGDNMGSLSGFDLR
jgi:hypothetical protein